MMGDAGKSQHPRMKETQAYIERVRRVNRGYQWLELAVDKSLTAMRAGQAILARRSDRNTDMPGWQPYLRQLWFPVAIQSDNIIVVETPAASHWQPSQLLSLIGPVGEPLRFRRKLRNILLIAHDTSPAPLLLILPTLLSHGSNITLALLGSARDYETGHLPQELEIAHADDDLTWQDMVMTLGWADQTFLLAASGRELESFSAIMRLIRQRRKDVPANAFFGVFQAALPCGVGACYACALPSRDGVKLRCQDGPAFDLTRLRLD